MFRSLTMSVVVFSVTAIALSTSCDPLPKNMNSASGQYCDLGLNSQSNGAEIAPNSTQYETSVIAQQFKTQSSINIGSITLRLEGTTTRVAGSLTVSIEEDSAGYPNNVPVASAQILASTVTQGFDNYQFNFANQVTLSADNTYWVVLNQQANTPNGIYWAGEYTQQPTNILGLSTVTQQWSNISAGINRMLLFSFGCVQ